ncbi:MAG: hypothetical protein GY790_17930 [Bacteroidetes bacterium]|nr:hypothetical protein [Bacteroidota bacterium]
MNTFPPWRKGGFKHEIPYIGENENIWPELSSSMKPLTRWWWMGAAPKLCIIQQNQ